MFKTNQLHTIYHPLDMFSTIIIYTCAIFMCWTLNVQSKFLTLEDRMGILEFCQNEIDDNPQILARAFKTEVPPIDDKYKEFLVCIYKLQGFYDEQTLKATPEEIVELLNILYDSEEVNYIMKDCTKTQGDSEIEIAYSLKKCLNEKAKDIDIVRNKVGYQNYVIQEANEDITIIKPEGDVNHANHNQSNAVSSEQSFSHCINKSGVNSNLVLRTSETGVPPFDSTYKDYLMCQYKLLGFYDGNTSKLRADDISELLANFYDYDEVNYIITACKKIQRDSDKETIYAILKCFLGKFKDVEFVRKSIFNKGIGQKIERSRKLFTESR